MEDLITIGKLGENANREIERQKVFDILAAWMNIEVVIAMISAPKNRGALG